MSDVHVIDAFRREARPNNHVLFLKVEDERQEALDRARRYVVPVIALDQALALHFITIAKLEVARLSGEEQPSQSRIAMMDAPRADMATNGNGKQDGRSQW